MFITAFFSKDGVPKIQLIPDIFIYKLSDNSLIVDSVMSEVAVGFYKYNFTNYDNSESYVILCDGGNSLSNYERYASCSLGATKIDLSEILEGSFTVDQVLRLMFSVLCGRSSGGGSELIIFRDSQNSKDRVTATVDDVGNRTLITLNGS